MKKICITGLNPAWQKTLTFENLKIGAVNRADDLDTIPSGKGINFARAVNTWGKAEGTVYQFLAGDAGKKIRQGLWNENISHISNETAGETRTCVTLVSGGDGNVTEIIEPSPSPDRWLPDSFSVNSAPVWNRRTPLLSAGPVRRASMNISTPKRRKKRGRSADLSLSIPVIMWKLS